MAEVKYNKSTGEAVVFDGQAWQPTKVVTHNKTGEKLAYDGSDWVPVGQPKRPQLSPEEFSSLFKQKMSTMQEPEIGTGEGVTRAALQGASFGTADEATAAIASMIGDGTYQQYLDRERAKIKQFREEQPVAAYGSEIAGSIPTSMLPVLNLARGGKVAQAAGTGALQGAVYGAGSAEGDMTDRFVGAGTGGVLGGTIGAASVPAVKGIQNLAEASGIKEAAKRLGITPETFNLMQRTMQADDSLSGVGSRRIRQAGEQGMIADAGPSAAGLLDTAIQSGGTAARVGQQATQGRVKAASGKLASILDEKLGAPRGVKGLAKDVADSTRAQRSAAYKEAYDSPIDYASTAGMEIEAVLDKIPTRVMREAVQTANERMQAAGVRNKQIMIDVAEDGSLSFREMPNVQQLDEIKKALGTMGAESVDQFGRKTAAGNMYSGLGRELRDAISDAAPAYETAVRTGGDKLERDMALDLGRRLFSPKTTREDVLSAAKGMSDAAKDEAKAGIRSYIDDTLANVKSVLSDPDTDVRETLKLVKDLSSRANREKLSMVLGEADANVITKQLDEAMAAFQLRAQVASNSKTFARQEASRMVKDQAEGGILSRIAEDPVGAVKNALRTFAGRSEAKKQAITDAQYEELAKVLTGLRGDEARAFLLNLARSGPNIVRQQQKAGRLTQQLLGRTPAMAQGPLASQLQE